MTIEDNAGNSSGADELDLFEAEATGQPVQTSKETTAPDKYAGKSVDDLIKMHQNAERLISRQGQEVATLRKTADVLLDLKKPQTKTEEPAKPVTVVDLLADPDKALKSVLDDEISRRTESSVKRIDELESRLSQDAFVKEFPSYVDDANDPAFIAWVQKNALRSALGQQAAQNNYVAAKQLWDMWGEYKELTSAAKPEGSKTAPKTTKTVRPAPNNATPERRYSRAKLMELRAKVEDGHEPSIARWKDPEFQANLIKAYAENRVV